MHFEYKKLLPFDQMPYERPDLKAKAKALEEMTQAFEAAPNVQEQIRLYNEIEVLQAHMNTLETLVQVRHSIDSTDEFYKAEKAYFEEDMPHLALASSRFYKVLLESPWLKELEAELGTETINQHKCKLRIISPEILEDLTLEDRLVNEYENLLANGEIEYEGQRYALSQFVHPLQSTDREERRKGHEAREAFFLAQEKKFDELYDQLVQVRHRIAQKLGFENFIEVAYLRLGRTTYGPKEVQAYRDQILRDLVPYTTQLAARHAKRIGLSPETFRYIDGTLSYKTGNAKPVGTPDEIVEEAGLMYDDLMPQTGEMFRMMRENGLMDLLAKKGKHGGGYMTMLMDYGVPFLFANFNGTQHDIEVMTHEAGHCFQGYMSRNNRTLSDLSPTLEACEIHSMSMEFLTWPYMERFFKEQTEKFKFSHLSGALTFIPYGVTVDEFQHYVYANPQATPEERKAKWHEIEKKYRPYLNYEGFEHLERGAFWHRQSHIFSHPFYYIDYTLAQIVALQYWKWSCENREAALKSYVRLCEDGGRFDFVTLVKRAGLTTPFEDGTVAEVAQSCQAVLNQIDDEAF